MAGSRFFAARSTRRLRSLWSIKLGRIVRASTPALVMSQKALSKPSGPRASTNCSNPLLLGSYYNEPLGRHQNSAITHLKPTHEDFDLVPDSLTLSVAHLLKNWSHLWKAIASMLHRCSKRRKPLFAGYDFNGHIAEAGLLKGATKHLGIAQREHAGVLERRRR